MSDYSQSNIEILTQLAEKVRKKRLRLNMTQKEVAELAGVHFNTISKFEQGNDITLMSLIQILRAVEELESLGNIMSETTESPVDLFRKQGKVRQRASGATNISDKTKTEW